MNTLALAVHEMVVGQESAESCAHNLSAEDRRALCDVETLVRRSPKDLLRVLAETLQDDWWYAVEPIASQA